MAGPASARQNKVVYLQIAKKEKIHKGSKWTTEVF